MQKYTKYLYFLLLNNDNFYGMDQIANTPIPNIDNIVSLKKKTNIKQSINQHPLSSSSDNSSIAGENDDLNNQRVYGVGIFHNTDFNNQREVNKKINEIILSHQKYNCDEDDQKINLIFYNYFKSNKEIKLQNYLSAVENFFDVALNNSRQNKYELSMTFLNSNDRKNIEILKYNQNFNSIKITPDLTGFVTIFPNIIQQWENEGLFLIFDQMTILMALQIIFFEQQKNCMRIPDVKPLTKAVIHYYTDSSDQMLYNKIKDNINDFRGVLKRITNNNNNTREQDQISYLKYNPLIFLQSISSVREQKNNNDTGIQLNYIPIGIKVEIFKQ
jgi:hypothetical protein